jgi:hypothetical protein
MNEPKTPPSQHPVTPERRSEGEGSLPPPVRPEIPEGTPRPEIPAKPSHDLPQADRERAENEGMTAHKPPARATKKPRAGAR